MSGNFWGHETKQLNQTIETYNNGKKRDKEGRIDNGLDHLLSKKMCDLCVPNELR